MKYSFHNSLSSMLTIILVMILTIPNQAETKEITLFNNACYACMM